MPHSKTYEKQLAQQRQAKAAGRIHAATLDLYAPADWERVLSCRFNLYKYMITYSPEIFYLPFCEDQLIQIQDLGNDIMDSQSEGVAAPRGHGKTEFARAAVTWATLFGHSAYSVLFGSTGPDAQNHLDAIKSQFENNALLCADFPHVGECVKALEGSSRRAATQRIGEKDHGGLRQSVRTQMEWSKGVLRFPTIPTELLQTYFSKWENWCSGAIIQCKPFDGAIRGLNKFSKRPNLVFLDDVETRESVKSLSQTDNIRAKIDTDIGGLAAQDKNLCVIYRGTIMTEDCVTAELTDSRIRPAFRGKRFKYLQKEPKNLESWEQYMQIRQDAIWGGEEKAKAFYLKNKKKMDLGSKVSWEQGYNPKKYISALEKYYAEMADKKENGLLYCACELQNDPSMLIDDSETKLTIEKITNRLSNLKKRRIPAESRYLAGFIDVHGATNYLYWGLIAFDTRFNGYVIDYNRYPESQSKTLGNLFGFVNNEIVVRKGLEVLIKQLSEDVYVTDSGLKLNPTFLIDSGWGETTNVVYAFCRENKYQNCSPSKGETVKFKNYNKLGKKDEIRGDNWRQAHMGNRAGVAGILFNTNYWKRFLYNRILAEKGQGALLFYGKKQQIHLGIAKHILAEKPRTIKEMGTGNQYEEWIAIPNMENHYLDVLVGCHINASVRGVKLREITMNKGKRRIERRKTKIKPNKL